MTKVHRTWKNKATHAIYTFLSEDASTHRIARIVAEDGGEPLSSWVWKVLETHIPPWTHGTSEELRLVFWSLLKFATEEVDWDAVAEALQEGSNRLPNTTTEGKPHS